MSCSVTQRVLSRGLRLFCRRAISKQSGFTVIHWSKGTSFQSQRLTHNFNTRLSSVGRLTSSTRFFSEDRIQSIDLEEEDEGHQLLSVIQTYQTASVQSRRLSPFFKQLKHCGSPSDVLDLTCKYAPTPRQVSNCLTHMWTTTKKMSDDQRRYELQLMFNHPAFDRLLQSSIKTVGHLNTEAIAYSLLSMVNLGVPQRSRVVQTFLRHCQVGIKIKVELDMFFDFCFFFFNVMCIILTGETEWLWWEGPVNISLLPGTYGGECQCCCTERRPEVDIRLLAILKSQYDNIYQY